MTQVAQLIHTPDAPDENLVGEEVAHFNGRPPLRVIAALIQACRDAAPPWWTADRLHLEFNAKLRMAALAARPDLRQQITTQLVGTKPKRARLQSPEAQADDIEAVIQSGDVTDDEFENAFNPSVLAVYMDAGAYWRLFREQMPWGEDNGAHQELIADLIQSLLTEKILTAHDVLMGIDRIVWAENIPFDIRALIDDALLKRQLEEPTKPFHAEDILTIATPAVITKHIKLMDLKGIVDRAEKAMGFEPPPAPEVETSSEAVSLPPEETPEPDSEEPEPAKKPDTPKDEVEAALSPLDELDVSPKA